MNKRVLYRWVLFFVYVAAVFILMIVRINPDKIDIPACFFGFEIDKLVHFAIFLPYSTLAWFAFSSEDHSLSQKLKLIVPVFFSGVTLAAMTEIAQMMTPFREGDIVDLSADIISLAAGSVLLLIWISLSEKCPGKRVD